MIATHPDHEAFRATRARQDEQRAEQAARPPQTRWQRLKAWIAEQWWPARDRVSTEHEPWKE
jgi:hypothetical protein